MISDLKFAILGCGEIGHVVGRHLREFGGIVNGMVKNERKVKEKFIDNYFTLSDLPEYLANSDYLINLLPSNPLTKNLLTPHLTIKYC